MTTTRTVEDCKRMLFKLAIKHGVAPKLISERLLSKEDKEDMLQGLVLLEMLDKFVEVWIEYGMCNYADGSGKPYSEFYSWKAQRVRATENVAPKPNLPHTN